MGNKVTDFLKDLVGGASNVIGGVKDNNTLAALLALGGASYAKDRGYLDKDIPVVGYQGKIPEYQAIQEQVTGRDDSNRRLWWSCYNQGWWCNRS